jgi:transcriptional regulator of acetoin/glycerol metabolism
LEETAGDVGEAARRLGVAKTTIYRHLKKWRIQGANRHGGFILH